MSQEQQRVGAFVSDARRVEVYVNAAQARASNWDISIDLGKSELENEQIVHKILISATMTVEFAKALIEQLSQAVDAQRSLAAKQAPLSKK